MTQPSWDHTVILYHVEEQLTEKQRTNVADVLLMCWWCVRLAGVKRSRNEVQHTTDECSGSVCRHSGNPVHTQQRSDSRNGDNCTFVSHGHFSEPRCWYGHWRYLYLYCSIFIVLLWYWTYISVTEFVFQLAVLPLNIRLHFDSRSVYFLLTE